MLTRTPRSLEYKLPSSIALVATPLSIFSFYMPLVVCISFHLPTKLYKQSTKAYFQRLFLKWQPFQNVVLLASKDSVEGLARLACCYGYAGDGSRSSLRLHREWRSIRQGESTRISRLLMHYLLNLFIASASVNRESLETVFESE